jgi:hypothetical protein
MTLALVHTDSLARETDALLAQLGPPLAAAELYLAGSAALALYLGHRRVRDLDLMAMANRLSPPERRDLLQALLAVEPLLRVETARDGFLALRGPDAVAMRLHYYPYPLAAPPAEHHGLEVASALDLGLMKLGALISRGTRRDFVDLYLLCQRLPLPELLAAAPDKFGHVGDFALQALKALADHSAALEEPMPPAQLATVEWEAVAAWSLSMARELGGDHVGASQ